MRNATAVLVLAATLALPQAILWADASTPTGAAPATTASTPQTKKTGHKGHHHHKKAMTSKDASSSAQPAAK